MDEKIRVFTLSYKINIIKKYDELKSFRKVAQEFNLDRNVVRNWVRSRVMIENAANIFG